MAEDLALDVAELKELKNTAKRPGVISLISSEIHRLDKLSKEPVLVRIPTPIATEVKVPEAVKNYQPVSSFCWDQDTDKVMIYVSMENVDKKNVESDFQPMSCNVKFHEVGGKNYRCDIIKLHKEIVPEKCSVEVKAKRVVISLWKASKLNWSELHFKEEKLKPNVDKDRDPMAGIMDLMKNMYEEGDDEMKKTIAKAWTDARSGKTADPLKSYR